MSKIPNEFIEKVLEYDAKRWWWSKSVRADVFMEVFVRELWPYLSIPKEEVIEKFMSDQMNIDDMRSPDWSFINKKDDLSSLISLNKQEAKQPIDSRELEILRRKAKEYDEILSKWQEAVNYLLSKHS